jgi:Na+-driven multidrug efflux pump
MLLISSSQLVVIGLVNREGLNTTAAYSASMQLWSYLQMPAFALSTAISAMVAQNIGAGQHQRVGEIARVGMLANLGMTGLLAIAVVAASHPLLALFLGSGSPALPIAQHIQYLVTWSYIVMGAMMVMTGTLRAYGVVLAPMIIQAIALYPVRLGFYFSLYPYLGADALWWSFAASSLVSVALTWIVYTRGSWRHRKEEAFPSSSQMPAGSRS